MTVWTAFGYGLLIGVPFGAIFNIPKYGKIILLGMACLAGGLIVFYPNITIGAFSDPWYIQVSNILGVVVGQLMGEHLLKQIFSEWGIKR